MSRKQLKHLKQPEHIEGDLTDPRSLGFLLKNYLEALAIKNFSPRTIQTGRCNGNRFIRWAAGREIHHATELTRAIIERYQKHLFYYRNAKNQPLSFRSQHSHLTALRSWMKWLAQKRHILYNPAAELEMPRINKCLPQHVLGPNEVEQLLNIPDVTTPLGLRDRAIMETLYSTGIRRLELAALQVYDLDFVRQTVMIRQGKGKKDRIVPIGDRACQWVRTYLDEARPLWAFTDHTTLFVTEDGTFFNPDHLSYLVRRYLQRSPLERSGGCHLFRHSMATAMLNNGADIRFIQAMLGHVSLETTQIYTQVGIKKLQEIHAATHPAKETDRTSCQSDDHSEENQASSRVS